MHVSRKALPDECTAIKKKNAYRSSRAQVSPQTGKYELTLMIHMVENIKKSRLQGIWEVCRQAGINADLKDE